MIDDPIQLMRWVLNAFTDYKLLFERSISFSDDALHIYAGVLIQLFVAAALKSSLSQWRPLLAVMFAELVNECLDIRHELWPSPSMQLGESVKDVLLTLALPITLFAISRWAPSVLVTSPAEPSRANESSVDGEASCDEA